MNVRLQIDYISKDGTKSFQATSVPHRGKSEQLALEFWEWIKREMPVEIMMEKIIADNEDITENVKQLEQEFLLKKQQEVDDLPF